MHFQQAYDPFRTLGSSWALLKRAPVAILLAGFLLLVTDGTSGLLPDSTIHVENGDWREVVGEVRRQIGAQLVAVIAVSSCLGIAAWLFRCWLRLGIASLVRLLLAGEPAGAGVIFSGGSQWGAMLLATFLRALLVAASALPLALILPAIAFAMHGAGAPDFAVAVTALGVAACYVPIVIYVALGLALAPMAVAFEGMQATEALSRSWELAKGRRWTLFLYYVVLGIVETVGAIACCCCGVGLVVLSITYTAAFESYAQLTGAAAPPRPPVAVGSGSDAAPIPDAPPPAG